MIHDIHDRISYTKQPASNGRESGAKCFLAGAGARPTEDPSYQQKLARCGLLIRNNCGECILRFYTFVREVQIGGRRTRTANNQIGARWASLRHARSSVRRPCSKGARHFGRPDRAATRQLGIPMPAVMKRASLFATFRAPVSGCSEFPAAARAPPLPSLPTARPHSPPPHPRRPVSRADTQSYSPIPLSHPAACPDPHRYTRARAPSITTTRTSAGEHRGRRPLHEATRVCARLRGRTPHPL